MADAPDAATAQRWCDMAAAGEFRSTRLRRQLRVQFILPRSGDRQFVCPLPKGLPRALRRQRINERFQELEEEYFQLHDHHGHHGF